MKAKKLVTVSEYILIFFLGIILALNYYLFIVKNNFAPAGVGGITTMIQYKTGISIGYMSLLINIPLCTLAYFFVDRAFAKRSLFFCLVYSISFLAFQKIGFTAFQYNADGHNTIFPVILSGVISGAVNAFCFKASSSTGGTDIISRYISKVKPELNFFYVTFMLNAVVAVASFFVYAAPDESGKLVYNYEPICLCVLYCFLATFVGNYIITGTKQAYKFTVITTHPDEINAEIFEKLRHGTTRVSAVGSYGKTENTVLLCVVNKHQIVDFKNILSKYDNTFSYYETVNETYGNFKKIR